MKPMVVYSIYDLRDFIGKSYAEIYAYHNALWKHIKQATGYTWDNQHFSVEDVSGHIQINLSFSEGAIHMYTSHGGRSLGEVRDSLPNESDIFTEEVWSRIDDFVNNISEGKPYCSICHKWVDAVTHYSYAGAACSDCCNEFKNKNGVSIEVACSPDTSGN